MNETQKPKFIWEENITAKEETLVTAISSWVRIYGMPKQKILKYIYLSWSGFLCFDTIILLSYIKFIYHFGVIQTRSILIEYFKYVDSVFVSWIFSAMVFHTHSPAIL